MANEIIPEHGVSAAIKNIVPVVFDEPPSVTHNPLAMTEPVKKPSNSAPAAGRTPLRVSVARLLIVASVAGTLLRFTVRDGIQFLAPFFYGLPPAIVTAFALLAWRLLRRNDSRWKSFAAVLVGVQCVLLVATLNQRKASPPALQSMPVAFWNISSGVLGREAISETIALWDADIVGLAESTFDDDPEASARALAYWEERFPDYHAISFPGDMVLLSRLPLTVVDSGKLAAGSSFGVATFQQDGRTVSVVMADLLSRPHRDRGPALEALTRTVKQLPPGPVIVMGDMNTPPTSVHFDELRELACNAFEERGNGFYHTWPMPLPVLPLDQVWVNDDVDVLECRLGWTARSDHRPVLTTVRLKALSERQSP